MGEPMWVMTDGVSVMDRRADMIVSKSKSTERDFLTATGREAEHLDLAALAIDLAEEDG